jgi:hypothetical protein
VQAVKNHNPQIIIIDEITTAKEAAAAKAISEKGVALVGTAHGSSLENLLRNPELNSLVGGVHQVTIGDMAAAEAARGTPGSSRCAVVLCSMRLTWCGLDPSRRSSAAGRKHGRNGKVRRRSPRWSRCSRGTSGGCI